MSKHNLIRVVHERLLMEIGHWVFPGEPEFDRARGQWRVPLLGYADVGRHAPKPVVQVGTAVLDDRLAFVAFPTREQMAAALQRPSRGAGRRLRAVRDTMPGVTAEVEAGGARKRRETPMRFLRTLLGWTTKRERQGPPGQRPAASPGKLSAYPAPTGPLATAEQRPWGVGDVVQEHYEIRQVLGGGMGLVYIAYDLLDANLVVLKTFKQAFLRNEVAVQLFLKEADTWITLDPHPNVVRAEIVLRLEGRPFILLEYVPGTNLRAWIRSSELTLTRSLDFAIQFCRGMHHAYSTRRLIHRDIKPENVLINSQGVLKITDFGLGLLASEAFLQDVASLPSTPEARLDALAIARVRGPVGAAEYRPPEQSEDPRAVGPEADIYAFGVMLYEMLTGQLPFLGPTREDVPSPRHLNQQIPPRLSGLVRMCLAQDPVRRWPDFAALQAELESIYHAVTGQVYTPPEAVTEETWCELGVTQFETGKVRLALASFEKALALNPESARAWIHKARVLTQGGQYAAALQCYDRALQVSQRLRGAWNDRGLLLHMMGDDREALRSYDKALALHPNYHQAWNNRSLSLFTLGRLNDALAALDRALALAPGYADAWFNRGGVLHKLGRLREALASYDKVIELTPHNPRPWKIKAIIAGELGDFEEALFCLARALAIDPDDEDALGGRKMLVQHLRKQYGPLAAAKWAQVQAPDTEKANKWDKMSRGLHRGVGTVLSFESANQGKVYPARALDQKLLSMWELGNYEEAIRYAEQALAIDPEDCIAWSFKGASLARLGRAQEGLACVDHALALDAHFHPAWNSKGVLLHELRRYEEAIQCCDEAIRLKSAYREPWNNKGNALKELGRYDEALACYDEALALDRRDAVAWNNKSATLVELERYEEALACCNQAVELDPRLGSAWHNKGVALQRLRRYEAALEAFDRAVELEPRATQSWKNRGEVLLALGRLAEAEQAIHRWESLKGGELVHDPAGLPEAVEARLAALEPGMAGIPSRLEIAKALRDLGRYEESLAQCDAVLVLSPQFVLALATKVATLVKMQRYEAALACYDELVTLQPDFVMGWRGRGDVLKKLGRLADALDSYNTALRLDSGKQEAAIWDAKGQILESMGRLQEALECYEHTLQSDPTFDWAWIDKGAMLYEQGRYQEAVACYDRALQLNPINSAAWDNKGNALGRLGATPEEVVNCYVRALQLDAGNRMAWNNAGVVYLNMQRYADALGYFEQALALDARYADAWFNKGKALKGLERYNEALACFDEVLRLTPEAYEVWEAKGSLLGKQGQLAEALACLDRSIAIYPHDYVPWFNKGALLFNARRYGEALTCFDQALVLAPNERQVRDIREICWQRSTEQDRGLTGEATPHDRHEVYGVEEKDAQNKGESPIENLWNKHVICPTCEYSFEVDEGMIDYRLMCLYCPLCMSAIRWNG